MHALSPLKIQQGKEYTKLDDASLVVYSKMAFRYVSTYSCYIKLAFSHPIFFYYYYLRAPLAYQSISSSISLQLSLLKIILSFFMKTSNLKE